MEPTTPQNQSKPKYTGKPRGFAAMSKEDRVRIARMGGKASHGSRKKV